MVVVNFVWSIVMFKVSCTRSIRLFSILYEIIVSHFTIFQSNIKPLLDTAYCLGWFQISMNSFQLLELEDAYVHFVLFGFVVVVFMALLLVGAHFINNQIRSEVI
jgi:hypothetical protein